MNTNTPTPLSLLQKIQQTNDPQAWKRFLMLYTPLLLRWAKKNGLKQHEDEDLVQQVLIKLIKELPHYKHEKFRGWLFCICKHECYDYMVRCPATRALPSADGLSSVVTLDKIKELDENEYRRVLLQRAHEIARRDFDPKTWAAYWEVVVNKRLVSVVASELQTTPGSVHTSCHRVKKRLREELRDFWD